MPVFDAHANLAITAITVAPSPALSGTSLTVTAGTAALFPAVPFNATCFPASASPTQTNAEIVRVTNIVGDVLTITRAQEGTTAKAISAGYKIANTATAKVFTDIETAVNALTAGAGVTAISAGTAVATGPQVVFSNSNGVSFGITGNTLTASVAAGGGGGAAISAGANSQSTGTVVFSNSNGITFGLSNNGVMTASVINTGNMAVSAGTQSNDVGTMVFSNSNNVTFGMTNSSIITASVSFAQSTQPVAASANNGSFLSSTLGFTDANGVTFGTSAGSLIFASVGAGASPGSISAGANSVALGQVVFSNSNNVSFGLNGSTVTASASGAGGAGFTYDGFDPFQGFNIAAAPSGARSLKIFPLQFPSVQFDRAGLLCAFANATNSTNTATVSVWIGLYSKNASTLSFIGSASANQVLTFSGTVNNSINAGIRLMTIPWTTTLAQSNYWMGVISLSTSGGASFSYYNASAAGSAFSGMFGAAAVGTEQVNLGLGWYSATATSFPASIAISEINGTGNDYMRFPMVQFINGTA